MPKVSKTLCYFVFSLVVNAQSSANDDCFYLSNPIEKAHEVRPLDEIFYDSQGNPMVLLRPFVWEVRDSRGRVIAHLLGTFHRYIDLKHFPEWSTQIVSQSQTVLLEHSSKAGGQVFKKLQTEARPDAPQSLAMQLTDPEIEKITADHLEFSELRQSSMRRSGQSWYLPRPSFNFRFFTPLGFALALEESAEISTDELRRKPIQVDDKIANLAEQAGARKHYLEESGGAYLYEYAAAFTVDKIRPILKTEENIFLASHHRLRESVAAYLTGDDLFFEKGVLENDEEERRAILDNRNLNWMLRIREQLTDSSSTLIAVGVSHMFGEYGLIALLEKEGFEVRRLSQPSTP